MERWLGKKDVWRQQGKEDGWDGWLEEEKDVENWLGKKDVGR